MNAPILSRPPALRALRPVAWAWMVLGAWAAAPALAEKADRQQPLSIEADRGGSVDLARRVVVFEGRVVLTQGSLRIRAERMEVAEVGEGQRTAVAQGLPGQPADFREKRDGVEEFVEGRADRIEFDSRENLVRLQGKAVARRLRGTQLADELQGESIVWNGAREQFSVLPPAGAATPGGRVSAVFAPAPKPGAGPAASAPAPAPAQAPAPANSVRR